MAKMDCGAMIKKFYYKVLASEDVQAVFIAQSPQMQGVLRIAEKAADSGSPVLIFGQAGTGRGALARWIHERGRRRNNPMFSFSCADVPQPLLERELFGFIPQAMRGVGRGGR